MLIRISGTMLHRRTYNNLEKFNEVLYIVKYKCKFVIISIIHDYSKDQILKNDTVYYLIFHSMIRPIIITTNNNHSFEKVNY